ncbi:endonuclease V [Flavisphingomonas formosensis]|uniref:endonuclease V n=1 Tax=Flavisphingomonas formosensis TaxID=861534 RepID=UPI0012FC52B4|nr:endonuclease V [Sphingomonas formosensis]
MVIETDSEIAIGRDSWLMPPDLRAASVAQREMAEAAEQADRFGPLGVIAGVDVSMRWRDTRGPVHAAIAPLRWPEREALPPAVVTQIPRIPYVPGYLGFREVPALAVAWRGLPEKPGLVLVDGHGRAHPRRCGIAVQLGLVLDVPTIGVGKTILCGRPEGELGESPGDRVPLVDRGEQIGVALRTRMRARPIYVSTGHRISLESAIAWVLDLCAGRRLPLTTHLAHDAANAERVRYAAAQL